jgi:hypothetical protein
MKGKRYLYRAAAIALALAISGLALSCELSSGMSSGLLSNSERNSLYTLTINNYDGTTLADGSFVYPGSSLVAYVVKKSGVSDPATMDLSLTASDGSSSAALRFATAVTPTAATISTPTVSTTVSTTVATKSVVGFDGKLEGFAIPSTAASGGYTLSVALSGSDGSTLQQEKLHLFVGHAQPTINSISVFPPSVEPNSSVLLSLTTAWTAIAVPASLSPVPATTTAASETCNPWIRWSKDGNAFAQGLLSDGLNKIVWTAPSIEGAYSITAEVFPCAPSSGASYPFKAAANQDLKVMVIDAVGGSGNDFADSLSFYSLLKLKGSFEDSGTRLKTVPPTSFGSPTLDTYSSGFGYDFGSTAGVTIPGLMPPSSSGNLGAFAVLVRMDSSGTNGTIVRFASADNTYLFSLGLKSGRPYIESLSGGQSQRSVASSAISQSPFTLEAVLTPDGDKLDIAWRAEGMLIAAPSIDLPAAPPAGSATLGGPLSLAGVYDGFGLMVPTTSSSYPSPAYRLAAKRAWKSDLVLAESFENGLPPRSVFSDPDGSNPSTSTSGILLSPSSSVSLPPSFGIGSGLVVEANIQGDRSLCFLEFSIPGEGRVFAVSGTGQVVGAKKGSDTADPSLGSFDVSGTRVRFSIEQKDGALSIVSGRSTVNVPSVAKQYQLSFTYGPAGTSNALVSDVIVRSSSANP